MQNGVWETSVKERLMSESTEANHVPDFVGTLTPVCLRPLVENFLSELDLGSAMYSSLLSCIIYFYISYLLAQGIF